MVSPVRFLDAINRRHTPQIGYALGQRTALVRLQPADEVPADGAGKERRFLLELLEVVLAEVEMGGWRVVEGEDIIRGVEFGDSDEANLEDDGVSCAIACLCTGSSRYMVNHMAGFGTGEE